MAQASIVREVREVVQTVSVEQVVLTLDTIEADFLNDLLSKIGGDPDATPRRYADSISAALTKAGVTQYDENTKEKKRFPTLPKQGHIYYDRDGREV